MPRSVLLLMRICAVKPERIAQALREQTRRFQGQLEDKTFHYIHSLTIAGFLVFIGQTRKAQTSQNQRLRFLGCKVYPPRHTERKAGPLCPLRSYHPPKVTSTTGNSQGGHAVFMDGAVSSHDQQSRPAVVARADNNNQQEPAREQRPTA